MIVKRILTALAATSVAIIMMIALSPSSALAANPRKTCWDSAQTCLLDGGYFSGGTISIDVDVSNSNSSVANRTWRLSINGTDKCQASFAVSDPPRSWVCSVPSGTVRLRVVHPIYTTNKTDLGLRW